MRQQTVSDMGARLGGRIWIERRTARLILKCLEQGGYANIAARLKEVLQRTEARVRPGEPQP